MKYGFLATSTCVAHGHVKSTFLLFIFFVNNNILISFSFPLHLKSICLASCYVCIFPVVSPIWILKRFNVHVDGDEWIATGYFAFFVVGQFDCVSESWKLFHINFQIWPLTKHLRVELTESPFEKMCQRSVLKVVITQKKNLRNR